MRDAVLARGSESVVVASLTRAAAREIASRDLPLPKHRVGTLHALCFHALGCPTLVERHLDLWADRHPEYRLSGGSQDLDEAVGSDTHDQATPGDRLREQMDLYRHRETPRELWPASVAAFATAWQEWLDETGFLDFTGLLEQALARVPSIEAEVLIGDECQDWSRLEARLFRDLWGQHAETVILAADPDQSIYAWRGADPRIFLDYPIPQDQERLLRQSYRVSRAVHDLALRVIGEVHDRAPVDYLPRDEEGEVARSGATWRYPEPLLPLLEEAAAGGETVMVLATCSFFLSPLLACLRRHALPFANPYRLRRGDWNPVRLGDAKRTTAADRVLAFLRMDSSVWGAEAREWTVHDLERWVPALKAEGLLTRGVKERLKAGDFHLHRDFGSLFEGGLDSEHAGKALDGDLAWFRAHLLDKHARALRYVLEIAERRGAKLLRDPPRIVPGTVHSVKGGEAGTVILFPDLSREAARAAMLPGGRDAQQRVAYVAVTRARRRVVLCQPASPFSLRVA